MPGRAATRLHTLGALARAGIVRPVRPDRAARAALLLHRYGHTLAAGYAVAATMDPDRPAIVDEDGTLSFTEVHRRTNALARALGEHGVGAGDAVGIMCRNHRGFIEATVAASKLGADSLYLNTSFAAPQTLDVVEREDPRALVYDGDFAPIMAGAASERERLHVLARWDADGPPPLPLAADLIAAGDPGDLPPPTRKGRTIILTSGTTGTPKGAKREQPESLDPAGTLLSSIPLRRGGITLIAPPLFHAWGFAHFELAMLLGSTLVLRRRFDPEQTLAAIARRRVDALVVVPVMLQRLLDLPAEVRERHDTSSLRVIAVSGSQLSAALARRGLEAFGDVIYNLYGSTEVAWASIATPADLRAAPGTAGRPPYGTVVRLYDEEDRLVSGPDAVGRIFVGNDMLFDGYTGGGGKPVIDGLMGTGDVGHFDAAGRLFVDGRDDDMIVSGGENVFPQEVEELLAGHPAIAEVAVFGVEDAEFGQRLSAAVVLRPGHALDAEELREHVKRTLAGYKAPREVEFLAELPRNITGKVLKRELRARAQDRARG